MSTAKLITSKELVMTQLNLVVTRSVVIKVQLSVSTLMQVLVFFLDSALNRSEKHIWAGRRDEFENR